VWPIRSNMIKRMSISQSRSTREQFGLLLDRPITVRQLLAVLQLSGQGKTDDLSHLSDLEVSNLVKTLHDSAPATRRRASEPAH